MHTHIKTYLLASLVLFQASYLIGVNACANASATPAADTPACPADVKQSAADATTQSITSNEMDAKRHFNEPVPAFDPKKPGLYIFQLKYWFYKKWVTENHCAGKQCHSHCQNEGEGCGSNECHNHCTDECLAVQTMSTCFAACKHMKQRALHNFVVQFKDNYYSDVTTGFGRLVLDPLPSEAAATIINAGTPMLKDLVNLTADYLPEPAINIFFTTGRGLLSYDCIYNLDTDTLMVQRKTTYKTNPDWNRFSSPLMVDKVEYGAGKPIAPDQQQS